MAGGDWLRLHRKALDSRAFSDDWLWRLWSWCLMKACWREGWKDGRALESGQFATDRKAAADQLNVSPSKLYRGLQTLQEWGQIRLEANSRFTTVTICNWRTYQCEGCESEQPVNSGWTAGEQRVNSGDTPPPSPPLLPPPDPPLITPPLHPPLENEEGEETKTVRAPRRAFVKPSLEEVVAYCRERGNGVDPAAWLAHYESNGWRVGRNPMKDWKAAVRTWEHNASHFGGNGRSASHRETTAQKIERLERERREKGERNG